MLVRLFVSLSFCLFGLVVVIAQENPEYGDYPEYAQDYGGYDDYGGVAEEYGNSRDNLYQDFVDRQNDGYDSPMGIPPKEGVGWWGGMGKTLLWSTATWVVGGRVHARGATKKLKTKFQKEQKALYTQYYNDVYKLTEQNNQLQYAVEILEKNLKETKDKAEMEAIRRDYEEFKQPDIDGDDRISRAEFNMYVKNYLSNYPGLQEKDYPKFDDFDHDGDGSVSFKEYAEQMALQVQQAELEQHYQQQKGGGTQKKTNALPGGTTKKDTTAAKKESFQDVYAQYLK